MSENFNHASAYGVAMFIMVFILITGIWGMVRLVFV
jgi:hypothetical protein